MGFIYHIYLILFHSIVSRFPGGISIYTVWYGDSLLFVQKMKVESFVLIKSVSLFLFMILFIISIYYYKKDSADGRLLIWRVSIDMIADAPLVGHGIGTFENKYMYYQAQYFESHPYSKYEKLADNIVYPYNEFLRIG